LAGTVHYSDVALLSVANHLEITTPPASGTGYAGVPFTFTVATSGGFLPLSYVWKKDGVIVFVSHSPSYTLVPHDETDAGTYTVDISDSNTDTRTASADLEFSTLPLPVAGLAGMAALLALMAIGGARGLRKK